MTDYIIKRLRSIDFTGDRILHASQVTEVVWNAAAEMERLRDELARNADKFRETLTELRQRVETLTAERDEARQMFCNAMTDHCEEDEARQIAREQGWDCFKEATGCSNG